MVETRGIYSSDHCLVAGEVEVCAVGDIQSGPRTVVSREALEKVVFLYLPEGRARICLSDAGEIDLGPGEMLVVFPGRVLTVEVTASSNRMMSVVLIGYGAVRAVLKLGFWDLLRTTEHYEENYMAEIIERFHVAPMKGKDERLLSQVEHLLSTVWLRIRHSGGHGMFLNAVRTLNREICEGNNLTTEKAAEVLGISRSKLNTLFINDMGKRPGEYFSRVIVALAEARLFWTTVTIACIAEEFGFSSVSSFAAFFRRKTGRNPTEFRSSPILIASERNTNSFLKVQETM